MINDVLATLKTKLLEIDNLQSVNFVHLDDSVFPKAVIEWDSLSENPNETWRSNFISKIKIYLKYSYKNEESSVLFFNTVIDEITTKLNSNKTLDGLVSFLTIDSISKSLNEDTQKVREVVFDLSIERKASIQK